MADLRTLRRRHSSFIAPIWCHFVMTLFIESPSSGNLVRTPSAQSMSQDDLVRKESSSGIHPIMERMAADNNEVRKWFFYYLDQLLGIQCHRIMSSAKKNVDGTIDDIYDVDTVSGAFIWKNELRKHWVCYLFNTLKVT